MEHYKVSEIFVSFEGEGLRTGELACFIRLFGCNLKCSYCDSRYACEGEDFSTFSLQQIMEAVQAFGIKNVTLTGGEPLIHAGADRLITALSKAGYAVNVETNGSVLVSDFRRKNVFFTCDFKCPTSLMTDKMDIRNLAALTKKDVLKMVVGSHADLECARKIITENRLSCYVYLSPIFGKIEAKQIAEFMVRHKLQGRVRLQLQLHKYVYPHDMRGV